jgi:hypothetical protein
VGLSGDRTRGSAALAGSLAFQIFLAVSQLGH